MCGRFSTGFGYAADQSFQTSWIPESRDIVQADRKGTWMYYQLSDRIQKNPGLVSTLRSMFAKTETGLHDIELLLEGLDDNSIAALKEAPPETVEFVIENCCSLGQ